MYCLSIGTNIIYEVLKSPKFIEHFKLLGNKKLCELHKFSDLELAFSLEKFHISEFEVEKDHKKSYATEFKIFMELQKSILHRL
jgi:hypothetical protein